jgi:hypothetical protein
MGRICQGILGCWDSILFTQVPALDTVHDKLESFVDSVPSLADPGKIKDDLAQEIFPGSNSAT